MMDVGEKKKAQLKVFKLNFKQVGQIQTTSSGVMSCPLPHYSKFTPIYYLSA